MTWDFPAPGTHTFTAAAVDNRGNTSTASVSVFHDPAKPTAYISSPLTNTITHDQIVAIRGAADSPRFWKYLLRWGPGIFPTSWTLLADRPVPVVNDVLGIWDIRGLLVNGLYTIQLLASSAAARFDKNVNFARAVEYGTCQTTFGFGRG